MKAESMKRVVAICAMAAMVLGGGSAFAAGNQEAAATAKAPVNLIWYAPGAGTFPYTDAQAVYDALNAKLAKDMGITLTMKVTGAFGQYKETMPLAMAAGEKMDMIWTSNWSNDYLKAATDGLYEPLDELLPKFAPTIWKDTKDVLEAVRVNGKIYGVWNQQIAAKTSNYIAREALVAKYGWKLDSVKQFSDLEPMLADVKKGEPDLIPISTRRPTAEWALPYLGITNVGTLGDVMGVRVEDKSCKVFSLVDDPEFLKIINLSWDWFNKGYIAKDGMTYSNDQWGQMANGGRIAFDAHNTWVPGAEVAMAPYGQKTIRQPFGGSFVEGASITSTLNAVSSRSANKETSVKLLEYLWTNQEAFNLLVWGIEGKHYAKLPNGMIKPDPKAGYYTNSPWVYGNVFLSYPLDGTNPESPKMTYDLNQKAKKATIMGFALKLDPIKSLVASVSAVKDQFYYPVTAGYVDPADMLPKYRAALKQAGLDQLIAETQKQIDAWLATKK